MSKVVLVCGGRDFKDRTKFNRVLDKLNADHGINMIVHGGARGADTMADEWAKAQGREWNESKRRFDDKMLAIVYCADWKAHGRSAGPIRNQAMLDNEPIDLVVAFPGGAGTADMVKRARRKGIEVMEIAP